VIRPAAVNLFIRWGKFNLVGAIGMAVQLASLALIWHLHYTWPDRRCHSTLLTQCLRFHLSNGLVSMIGNLALMRILVSTAHLPVLIANCIAILCCSIINFGLGNNWAFPGKPPQIQSQPT